MGQLSQRLTWRLEALAYDTLSLAVKAVPFSTLSAFGGKLLRTIGPRSSKDHIARTNLRIAFPDLPDAALEELMRQQWDNCGRTFAEFPALHRLKAFAPNSKVTVEGLEILKAHNPAVLFTGHFANWEVMALIMTQAGLPVQITYRKINNPYIDARVRKKRQAYGTKLLVQKSGVKGARQLIDAIENNESVALLTDQKFNEGLSLPFFSEDAMTATGAVRLALKTGRPLIPLSLARNGASFHMTIHDPVDLVTSGIKAHDTENGVRQINQFLEDVIRVHPEQWFWVHRRWPKALYKRSKS
ncbi:MAG: lysophospholipid acyltransferase family protein [Maricaulaceae bacterium]